MGARNLQSVLKCNEPLAAGRDVMGCCLKGKNICFEAVGLIAI